MYTCGLTVVIKQICYVTLCYVTTHNETRQEGLNPPYRDITDRRVICANLV